MTEIESLDESVVRRLECIAGRAFAHLTLPPSIQILRRKPMLRRFVGAVRAEVGQTTAEYALVILGAAAIGALLIAWATKSHAIGKLFDEVVGKVLP